MVCQLYRIQMNEKIRWYEQVLQYYQILTNDDQKHIVCLSYFITTVYYLDFLFNRKRIKSDPILEVIENVHWIFTCEIPKIWNLLSCTQINCWLMAKEGCVLQLKKFSPISLFFFTQYNISTGWNLKLYYLFSSKSFLSRV